MKQIPPELDRIADAVLNYRPKPKSKAAKKRARRAKNAAKKGQGPTPCLFSSTVVMYNSLSKPCGSTRTGRDARKYIPTRPSARR